MNFMSREYDIQLTCGCQISLDGGGGLIPCLKDECVFEEEYLLHPDYPQWCVETYLRYLRNTSTPSDVDIAVIRADAERRQAELRKGLDDTSHHQVKGFISEKDDRYF